eukprot:CAMPEP_0185195372 /NCGR_PEP_ID=MMETSP1140-20130426/34352_1 /TAXON_ID=298111 /ORGANISM="Pavlova sp., Strain CCMP459" /LENGTH=50 /DNA_ID=CAMNT_0027762347 /DNA_START=60 /DNA_END=208 /DNA_ORIENTATION=-
MAYWLGEDRPTRRAGDASSKGKCRAPRRAVHAVPRARGPTLRMRLRSLMP